MDKDKLRALAQRCGLRPSMGNPVPPVTLHSNLGKTYLFDALKKPGAKVVLTVGGKAKVWIRRQGKEKKFWIVVGGKRGSFCFAQPSIDEICEALDRVQPCAGDRLVKTVWAKLTAYFNHHWEGSYNNIDVTLKHIGWYE